MKQCQYCDWWDKTVPSATVRNGLLKKGCKCSITSKVKLASEGKRCKNFCFAYETVKREAGEASQTSGK